MKEFCFYLNLNWYLYYIKLYVNSFIAANEPPKPPSKHHIEKWCPSRKLTNTPSRDTSASRSSSESESEDRPYKRFRTLSRSPSRPESRSRSRSRSRSPVRSRGPVRSLNRPDHSRPILPTRETASKRKQAQSNDSFPIRRQKKVSHI